MITKLAIEVVRGILTKTQTITYASGKTVRRLFPSVTAVVPSDIEEIKPHAVPVEEIHNQEYLLYKAHMGL